MQTSHYKDQPSYVLENDILRAEFIAHGGRMVSLRHKPSGFEFLYQQPGEKYEGAQYDKAPSPEQSAGYDDMFPTIDECHYEDHPWKGTVLPDHGEAWSLDWDVVSDGESIRLSYYGTRLPYKLTRRIAFEKTNALYMDYSLENFSAFPLFYIWSAHPMLVAPAGARIAFPQECHRAVAVVSNSGRLGVYGDEFEWPIHNGANGAKHNLSLVRDPGVHDHEKYFFKNRLTNGSCGVRYPDVQLALTLEFPVESVPYAAVVLGEGWMREKSSFLMLEPCSAPFDRLDLSKRYTRDSKVEPKNTNNWFLRFSVEALE
jgi:galactose mutarotase-like enzyme